MSIEVAADGSMKGIQSRLERQREPQVRSEIKPNGSSSLLSREFAQCLLPRPESAISNAHKPGEDCPADCGYVAEDYYTGSHTFCKFKCVAAEQCGNRSAATSLEMTYADKDLGLCKFCPVQGCKTCRNHTNLCQECSSGWSLDGESCKRDADWIIISFVVLAAIICVYGFAWWVSVCRRPCVNLAGEAAGLKHRTAQKLLWSTLRSEDARESLLNEGEHKLVSVRTNTLQTPIAGPGSVLYFRFQVFIIALAFLTWMSWIIWAAAHNDELLSAGSTTPENWVIRCRELFAGKKLQDEEWEAVKSFMGALYIGSILVSLVFAYSQLNEFRELDDLATMKDFALHLTNLPPVLGSEKLEVILKDLIESVTGQGVEGVSVAWTYEHEAHVQNLLEEDMVETEAKLFPDKAAGSADPPDMGEPRSPIWWPVDWFFVNLMLGIPLEAVPVAHDDKDPKKDPNYLATTCVSSERAIVVFKTEHGRDKALKQSKGKIQWGTHKLRLKPVYAEPSGVRWGSVNVGSNNPALRIVQGLGMILLGEVTWALTVYWPYAYYVSGFSYANGDEPGMESSVFSVLVSLGNQALYVVCLLAAERVGFFLNDTVQAMYMVTYMCTIMINISVDITFAVKTGYDRAVGVHARTADGILIRDLPRWSQVIQAYEIQHEMGAEVYLYGFPTTYFTPYIMELACAGWFIFHIQRRWVRSAAYLRGWQAEKALKTWVPVDASRYADVISSLLVAQLIWITPTGYVSSTFLSLFICNILLFFMDQHKALRWAEAWCFSSTRVDSYAFAILGLPLSLIPTAMFVKEMTCRPTATSCRLSDAEFFSASVAVYLGIVALHAVIFLSLPMLAPEQHKEAGENYSMVASRIPRSWFNTNPMHCLRSKYVYKHNPPCEMHIIGKDNVLQKSEEAKCYFEDRRGVQEENYWRW